MSLNLKPGERTITPPNHKCPYPVLPASPFRPRHDRYVALIDPPPEKTDGGIYLPNMGDGFGTDMGPAGEMRADAGTVLQAHRRVPLKRGDRVSIVPYAGHRWLKLEGLENMIVVGDKDDYWLDLTPLVWRKGKWSLLGNWIAIEIDVLEYGEDEIALPGPPRWLYTGTIVDVGPDATMKIGTRIVVNKDIAEKRPDDSRYFSLGGSRTVLVREVDSFGVDRIEAVILDE